MAAATTAPVTRRTWTDLAWAVLLTAVATAITAIGLDQVSNVDRPVDAWAIALVLVAGLALVGRSRVPLAVLAVSTVATTAYLWIGYPYGPILALLAVAAYAVARHHPPSTSVSACGLSLVVLVSHLLANDAALPGWVGLLPATAWIVLPWAIGTTRRTVREADERARDEALRSRLDDQRLHLAQEVHDVVGHGLSAIQMQADVALHVMDRRPEQGEEALRAISRTAAEAVDELRATLHLVRSPDQADRSPPPGLARLDDLCRRTRHAGVEVDLDVRGRPRELSTAVDLAAYRILQESLTNVVRHGPVPTATVRVTWHDDHVDLAVANPADPDHGPPPASDEGSGIRGMRDRAGRLGGTIETGPTGDGFEVVARLPTEGTS